MARERLDEVAVSPGTTLRERNFHQPSLRSSVANTADARAKGGHLSLGDLVLKSGERHPRDRQGREELLGNSFDAEERKR